MLYVNELSQISELQSLVLFSMKLTDIAAKANENRKKSTTVKLLSSFLRLCYCVLGRKTSILFGFGINSLGTVSWYHVFNRVTRMHFKANIFVRVTCFITIDRLRQP